VELKVSRASSIQGTFRPPSDKSLTHRSYMLGAIADGPSEVRLPLEGEDCESTLACLASMGLRYERGEHGVKLTPIDTWRQPDGPLDCGNSGTTMRLLSGLIASRDLCVKLVGDASLSRRPMKRIAEPLRLMGAQVEGDTPPLTIRGGRLNGIHYESPVASAQIKSCVLLAGLGASGETMVREPYASRDHTERMLTATGVEILRKSGWVGVRGGSRPHGFQITVPGDISSAAFLMVAAALLPKSAIVVQDLGVNPTRSGLLDIFEQSQIDFFLDSKREELGEPVSDVHVRYSPKPKPFVVEGSLVPRLIDEIPILAVLASQCHGVSVVRDARELRVKESDRIELIAKALRSMGGSIETHEDGFEINGPTPLRGATIETDGDHRIGMAFAIAGILADGSTTIQGAEAIATSFPAFEKELERLIIV
jgi:3-phosphoshikimate 1-carboxyvinyltransferase